MGGSNKNSKKAAPSQSSKTESASEKKKAVKEEESEPKGVKEGISAFSHHGGDAAKELATEIFNAKKALTPEDWKEGIVKDDRHVSYLPPDWTPGLKMTDGGILIKVLVGPPPERKHFFHKPDLEKYLDRKLNAEERGRNPKQFTDIDPKKFIKRKDRGAMAGYINERCNRIHGMTVEEAIGTLVCEHRHGEEKRYALTDLKYDLKCDRIELVDERPSQSSNPEPLPATPCLPGTPARLSAAAAPSTPGTASSSRLPATPAARLPATPSARLPATPSARLPGTPKARLPATPTAAPATPRPVKRQLPSTPTPAASAASAPSTPQPLKKQRTSSAAAPGFVIGRPPRRASARPSESSSTSSAKTVFESCYETLKTRAATATQADETAIFTMVGVGFSLGLESPMLKMLPELLKKKPADRGVTMQFILDQFEQALLRA
mmetsp:Transcript_45172/g.84559  ORF Transcript_45172/g.84559 Transcript_45172/m.84559 type:complete len:436 (-) Transcript_45172:190-1497(-)